MRDRNTEVGGVEVTVNSHLALGKGQLISTLDHYSFIEVKVEQ
jgi:hypothetical protein